MKGKKIVLASYPKDGTVPSEENFRVEDEDVPVLQDGEVLLKTLYLSVDPYMRNKINPKVTSYGSPLQVGETMIGVGIGEVIESKSTKYNKGDIAVSFGGWRTHVVAKDFELMKFDPSLGDISKGKWNRHVMTQPDEGLGAVGMIGVSAYGGFVDITNPKPGETVVVSAAAGAVGSLVGQIAKIKGCRVVGIAGGKHKCDYLISKLKFDAAIDYKSTKDMDAALKEACPKGIDVYFDNVGGSILEAVLLNLNQFARISICGQISGYNEDPSTLPGLKNFGQVLFKQAKIEGFLASRWYGKAAEDIIKQMSEWVKEGKIIADEHIENGFENAPKAFKLMMTGGNIGKVIVKVADRQP